MKIEIKHLERKDAEIFVNIVERAYNYDDRNALYIIFQVNMDTQEDGCLAISLDGKYVATGCFFVYGYLAWIGFVGVLPEYQRKGIGTMLFRHILGELNSRNVRTIKLDASSKGYGLYKKFGFVDEYPTVTYEFQKIPYPKGKVCILQTLTPEIIDLDSQVFGEKRIKALEAWIKCGGEILVTNEGYALLKMKSVGPLIARDLEEAEILLSHALNMGARRIIVPHSNFRAVRLIRKFGGVERNRTMRMRLGGKINENISWIYGILSLAKG